ncbi:hypothetical protein [Pseudomonas sp. NPDC089406]|uniref:hypothetical protein n=1 Tax=Pseudomonas sp. NPDC089406 TaxID=3364463 RepID=UPI00384BCB54
MSVLQNYEYGSVGVTLSSSQLAVLEAVEGQASVLFEQAPETQGLAYSIYNTLLSFLPEPEASSQPGEAGWAYKQVYTWIEGARGVNSNQGVFAEYIRAYTGHQYTQRFGSISDSDLTDLVNKASNAIGLTLAERIISNDGRLPSIEGLGAVDAGESARNIFLDSVHYPQGDYTGWAGTLLFSFLGYHRFFNEWLLEQDSVVSTIDVGVGDDLVRITKNVPGSYDFFSALQAHVASVEDFSLWEKIQVALKERLDVEHSELLINARQFMDRVYGASASLFNVEDLLPFATPLNFQYAGLTVNVGTLGSDHINGYPGWQGENLIIHAGQGSDLVSLPNYLASGAFVLLDGGEGFDVLDAYQVLLAQRVVLKISDSPLYSSQFTLNDLTQPATGGPQSYAFSFETVNLGAASDLFSINPIHSADADLVVDMGGGGIFGNTIDFSRYDRGVDLDLTKGDHLYFGLSTGQQLPSIDIVETQEDGFTLTVMNVSNIIGTAGSDTLTGNVHDNILDAGTGENTLWGGMGADTFIVDQGNNTIMDASAEDRLVIRLPMATTGVMLELAGGTVLKARVDNFNGAPVALTDDYAAYFHPVEPYVTAYTPALDGYSLLNQSLGSEFLVKYVLGGGDLTINVRMRDADGGILSATTVVKDYEDGDLGLSFKEIVVPNINNAAAGQGSITQIAETFMDAQFDLIKEWQAPPGYSDIWYA